MKTKVKKSKIFIVLDNIRSALNVGAIFRTCDAVGVDQLLLCGITAYPPHSKLAKTALGACETVEWKYFNSTLSSLEYLQTKEPKIEILSVEITDKAVSMWEYNFHTKTVLVFGNEISGVSKEVLTQSDAHIKIPMFGQKVSLNVATSCGIVAYEVKRKVSK